MNISFEGAGLDPIPATLKRAAIPLLLRDIVKDVGTYAEYAAKRNVKQRTGNLHRAIKFTGPVPLTPDHWVGWVRVGRGAPYAEAVEGGSGIFGPHKSPIRPRAGNVLVFKVGWPLPPTKQAKLYRNSVRGQKGQHYMRDAYEETKRIYVPLRLQAAKITP